MMPIGDLLVNIANTIYLLAFLIRDILWLRVFVICSCILVMIYGAVTRNYTFIFWNAVFFVINLVQVILLIIERRPVTLSETLERIYLSVFWIMTREEFLKLWNLGEDITFEDEQFLKMGEVPLYLYLILDGEVEIKKSDRVVACLGSTYFIGEMSFINQSEATADVFTKGELRVKRWAVQNLYHLEIRSPEMFNKLNVILGQDLSRKVHLKAGEEPDEN